MDGSVIQTWLSDVLHGITQGLLAPDIIMLIAFIGYALFCIGSVLVEYFTERKYFKVAMPKFLAALMSAEDEGIPAVIEESGLLARQKVALLTVYDYRMLPGDALVALIRRLVSEEESRYDRITGRNNMAARVSPMLGLMGTLIPLGPGITALGSANTELLSASLNIAFDTTVAGLVVAAVCMVIGKIRSIWYGNYMSALDSGMATMLEKIEEMRAAGKIVTKEPSDYAFLFEQTREEKKAKGKGDDGDKAASADRPSVREKMGKRASLSQGGTAAGEEASLTASGMPQAQATENASRSSASPLADIAASAVADAPERGADAWRAQAVEPGPVEAAPSPAPAEAAPAAATTGPLAPAASALDSALAQDAPLIPGISGDPQFASPITYTAPLPKVESAGVADAAGAYGAQPSFTYEPYRPQTGEAAFTPVPDPTFISDLVAAAEASPASQPQPGAPAQAATGPLPVIEPLAAQPVAQPAAQAPEQAPAAQTSGWYNPRKRDDA